MFFCENDNNKLYIKIDDDESLKYYCKLCMSEYNLEDLNKKNNCVSKQTYNNKSYLHKTFINDNLFDDPTLPRVTNLKCINDNCKSNTEGVQSEIIYIKYDKLELKFLYCCAHCKQKWTSNNVSE